MYIFVGKYEYLTAMVISKTHLYLYVLSEIFADKKKYILLMVLIFLRFLYMTETKCIKTKLKY